MRKEKVKNVVIMVLVLIVLAQGFGVYKISEQKNFYQEALKQQESAEDGEDLIYAFTAGMNSFTVELFYEEGMIADDDYHKLKELEKEFLKEPTYEKVYQYDMISLEILGDASSKLLDNYL